MTRFVSRTGYQRHEIMGLRFIDSEHGAILTTCFHAITEAVKTAAVDTQGLQPQRITVIERGRDGGAGRPSDDERRLARVEFGLKESDEVIVSVGPSGVQKGQRYLLEAMADVVKHRPPCRAAPRRRPGRQSEALKEIWKANRLNGQVRLLGYREDVPQLLAAGGSVRLPVAVRGSRRRTAGSHGRSVCRS